MQASPYLPILTTLSLITTPFTEYLWTWDHFLQVGRDFELSLIALWSFLCLAMVLSKSYKHYVDVPLSAQRWLAATFDDFVVLSVVPAGPFLNLERVPPHDPSLCASELPLQI